MANPESGIQGLQQFMGGGRMAGYGIRSIDQEGQQSGLENGSNFNGGVVRGPRLNSSNSMPGMMGAGGGAPQQGSVGNPQFNLNAENMLKQQRDQYGVQAGQQWYSGLSAADKAKFAPQGQSATTQADSISNAGFKPDADRLEGITKQAALQHFQQNILPQDQKYQQLHGQYQQAQLARGQMIPIPQQQNYQAGQDRMNSESAANVDRTEGQANVFNTAAARSRTMLPGDVGLQGANINRTNAQAGMINQGTAGAKALLPGQIVQQGAQSALTTAQATNPAAFQKTPAPKAAADPAIKQAATDAKNDMEYRRMYLEERREYQKQPAGISGKKDPFAAYGEWKKSAFPDDVAPVNNPADVINSSNPPATPGAGATGPAAPGMAPVAALPPGMVRSGVMTLPTGQKVPVHGDANGGIFHGETGQRLA